MVLEQGSQFQLGGPIYGFGKLDCRMHPVGIQERGKFIPSIPDRPSQLRLGD